MSDLDISDLSVEEIAYTKRLQINIFNDDWIEILYDIRNNIKSLRLYISKIIYNEVFEIKVNNIDAISLNDDEIIMNCLDFNIDCLYAITNNSINIDNKPTYLSLQIVIIVITAFLLGFGVSTCIFLVIYYPDSLFRSLYFYFFILGIFHYLEFLMTALFHPLALTWSSYLLDHSKEYGIAFTCSMFEFLFETFIFTSYKKSFSFMLYPGIVICLLGQILRSGAMFSAKQHFTHKIATNKVATHELVTTGVYKYVRHPSYAGWFFWSAGTQITLNNPICTVLYIYAAWNFFNERIPYEERYLLRFFGNQYYEYKKKVPSGVPFIK